MMLEKESILHEAGVISRINPDSPRFDMARNEFYIQLIEYIKQTGDDFIFWFEEITKLAAIKSISDRIVQGRLDKGLDLIEKGEIDAEKGCALIEQFCFYLKRPRSMIELSGVQEGKPVVVEREIVV